MGRPRVNASVNKITDGGVVFLALIAADRGSVLPDFLTDKSRDGPMQSLPWPSWRRMMGGFLCWSALFLWSGTRGPPIIRALGKVMRSAHVSSSSAAQCLEGI